MLDVQIRENWQSVRSRIAEAARRAGRTEADVTLVAVTKQHPPEWIAPLIALGQRDLGENFPQELWKKIEAFEDAPVRWHVIGHLQSNKVKRTVPLVHMIHSVDDLKRLKLIDQAVADGATAPELCLQVNVSREPAKHGWPPEALLDQAETIARCGHLPIRGLMTIAAFGSTPDQARREFAELRELREPFQAKSGLELPELSMGMTNDFEAAIEEGATIVRVGSALFEGLSEPETS